MRLVYELPWPPSANASHVNRTAVVRSGKLVGKVYTARMISDETRAFRAEVAMIVRAGHKAPPRLTGRLKLTLLTREPAWTRTRDVSNAIKQSEDAIKLAGVVLDDSQFDHVQVFRGEPTAKGRILVSVEGFDPEKADGELRRAGLPGYDLGMFAEEKEGR